jgi:predicted thioredoxin/glutaredoxin
MEKKDEELIQSLLEREPELKQHYEEHLMLEQQLADFNRKLYLTPEQEIEKKALQKRKLIGKDRIMQILDKHRAPSRGASA